jgi:hypothetical protein
MTSSSSAGKSAMQKTLPVLLGAAIALSSQAAAKGKADPLDHMNRMFRAEYKAARAEVIRKAEPIIVVAFDDLVLYWKGKRIRQGFTPRLYHEVKAVAHVPLTLYVMLHAQTGRRIGLDLEKRLNDLRGRIVAAEKSLAGRPGWTPAILRLHRTILARALRLIDGVLARARISRARLTGFARGVAPLLLASADVAARAQLSGLNALLNRWKAMLGPDWNRVKVANLAPRQAEPQNAQGSFVTAYFGRHLLNRRVFMTRNIFGPAGARTLLGTIYLDRAASIAFFGHPARLERDLLSDAAKRQIWRLLRKR